MRKLPEASSSHVISQNEVMCFCLNQFLASEVRSGSPHIGGLEEKV